MGQVGVVIEDGQRAAVVFRFLNYFSRLQQTVWKIASLVSSRNFSTFNKSIEREGSKSFKPLKIIWRIAADIEVR